MEEKCKLPGFKFMLSDIDKFVSCRVNLDIVHQSGNYQCMCVCVEWPCVMYVLV